MEFLIHEVVQVERTATSEDPCSGDTGPCGDGSCGGNCGCSQGVATQFESTDEILELLEAQRS